MTTKTNKNETVLNETALTNNPFAGLTAAASSNSDSRRMDFTPALINRANQRAQEVMLKGSEHAELANKVINDGDTSDLLELIDTILGQELIAQDAEVLEGCDPDQLARLLESRRSDRSKAKKKGLNSSVIVCKTYISAMYAELMIRIKMDKPYAGAPTALNYSIDELAKDQDALTRKIASLQSKQSRLRKLAEYDEAAKSELSELQAEIARLSDLRTGTRVKTKTAVQSPDIEAIRATLKSIDPATLPVEDQEKFLALMAKLG